MEYAFIFFLIFGVLIIFAGCSLYFSKDPRRSVFFARVREKQNREDAQKTAKEIAVALFGVGAAIIVYCVIGFIRGV
ncbi:MAG: hypothetical protein IJV40_01535 [Oscillospiraceae bacterium]|nr:hypothetical protein [Oscillospiraceae bacterium]